ncbi:MAG TPA: APC family permease [Actinomycetota bacterium]
MTNPPGPDTSPSGRLARRLGTGDAVVIGLGSMLGAGVFAAFAPAAAAAGSGLLFGLLLAALVAGCNATSSAELAAIYPSSGGTYVYGRERLGKFWGYLAGWAFVSGKTASCAAMALTFGTYAAPRFARPLAVAAVAGLTAVNYRGIAKTAWLTRLLVALVVAALAAAVTAALLGGQAEWAHLGPLGAGGPRGVLEAGGLLFFAFAGYARIATLGEEVVDPERTIPRAIPRALTLVLVIYAVVALAALLTLGPGTLAHAHAPLAAAAGAGSLAWLVPVVRAGAVVAALSSLLSLLVGVSRTTFAMAGGRDLPGWLDAVHPRYRVPHRAELAIAALVIVVLLAADLRGAIGFSSFNVLGYYAIANAAAWTLPPAQRRWPRWFAAAGAAGCVLLALSLPLTSIAAGAGVLAAGVLAWVLRGRYTAHAESGM